MFANFSFPPSSTSRRPQSQHHHHPAATREPHTPASTASLSPTSSRSASPSRPPRHEAPPKPHIHLSVTDLTHKLSAHTLAHHQPRHTHTHPRRHHASNTPTPPPSCEGDDGDERLIYEPARTRVPRSAAERGACRRRQRQVHSRLQCDAEHLKALAELVAGMVRGGSQCFVYEAPGVGRTAGASSGEESSEASGDDGRARALCRKHSVEWANGGMGVVKAGKVGRGGGKGARRGR